MPITPTPGTDALAAGIPLVPGNGLAADLEEYINRLADYVAQRTDKPGTPRPLDKGGTAATTAAAARTNLDVPSNAKAVLSSTNNQIRLQWNASTATLRLTVFVDGINVGALAYTSDLGGGGYLPTSGGTVTGDLFLPNSTPASSGYTVAYINSDGRVSRGASSARYKDEITAVDPASLGDIFPEFHSYVHREDEARTTRYGYIAEHLAAHPDQEPFVVYDLDGRADSIDFIALLLAQNAQLNQGIALLTQRIDDMEARHANN